MSTSAAHESTPKNGWFQPVANKTSRLLQRNCGSCGNHTIAGGECSECSKGKRLPLQTKLTVNEPGDIYEQEADRIADQVLAIPVTPHVSNTPPRIQRLTGRPAGQAEAVPASVDRVLASPGRPLELGLRQDMEQRFGYDFSGVRVHSDRTAEQSTRELNANAYTIGANIAFGAGRFAPEAYEGRRLIAHELAHTVQQGGNNGSYSHTHGQQLFLHRQLTTSAQVTSQSTEQSTSHDADEHWNITFPLTRRNYDNLTREQAIRALRTHYRLLSRMQRIQLARHRELRESRDGNWLVDYVSETIAWAELPPERIWDSTRSCLEAALETINGGLIESSCRNLERATVHYLEARDQLDRYADALRGGVEYTGIGAHGIIALATITAIVVTGGAAAPYGAVAVSGTAGLTAGVFGAGVEGATQAGELQHGFRDEVDIGEVFRRGAEDAVLTFFATLVGGALAGRFLQRFETAVISRLTQAQLQMLSRYLGPNFLDRMGRLLADFLGGAGAGLTMVSIRRAFRHIREGSVPTLSELVDEILQEMLRQGVIQVLIGFVARQVMTRTSRPQDTTESAPQSIHHSGSDASLSSPARPIGSGRATSSRRGRLLGATMRGTAEIPAFRGEMPPIRGDILSAEAMPLIREAASAESSGARSSTIAEPARIPVESAVEAPVGPASQHVPRSLRVEPPTPSTSPAAGGATVPAEPAAQTAPATPAPEFVSSPGARTVRVTPSRRRPLPLSSPIVEQRRSSAVSSSPTESYLQESPRQPIMTQERLTRIEGEEGRALSSSETEIRPGVRRRTTAISGRTAQTTRPIVRANLEQTLQHIDELEASGALSAGHASRMRMSGGTQLATHAEVQQSILHPNQPIVVNEPMCFSCFDYFRAEARFRGVTQRVTDTQMIRLFHPDGTVSEGHISTGTANPRFRY